MNTNTPELRVGLNSLKYPALGLLTGIVAYQLGANLLVTVIFPLLLPLALVIVVAQSRVILFKKHLSAFGAQISSDEIEQRYSTDVLGIVPFKNSSITCTVYTNEDGIAIGRQGKYRKLAWAEIAYFKRLSYLDQPVAELSVGNMQVGSRLIIPWSDAFNDYLPSSMCQ